MVSPPPGIWILWNLQQRLVVYVGTKIGKMADKRFEQILTTGQLHKPNLTENYPKYTCSIMLYEFQIETAIWLKLWHFIQVLPTIR